MMRGCSSLGCIIPRCHFASGGAHKRHAVCAHLPQLFGLTNLSNRQMAQLLEPVQFMASTAMGCTVEALTVGTRFSFIGGALVCGLTPYCLRQLH